MRSTLWMPLFACLALAPGAAGAASDLAALERGCLECHNDPSRGALPLLEGQQADYLVLQLRHFRERHRDAWPMRTIAEGLTEDEAARLAAALASRPWREEGYGGDPRRIAEGAAIVARYECASCHGTEYAGAGVVPRTAGQRAPYLERQLAGFADGSRFHPPTGTGARMYSMTAREAAATAQFLASLAPSPAPAGAVDLAWLAGYWCARSEGTDSEELWLAPRGGLMLGLHRDSAAGKATGFEFLRIEYQGDRATLLAQPGGRAPATAFELAERGPARAVFANPAHDYPKRITYQRLGEDTLLASIEGGEGTEAQRWTWTRDCR